MYLIAVDPGQSTGVAEYADAELIHAWTFTNPGDLRALLRNAARSHPAFDVVCERGPTDHRHMEAVCAEIEAVVRQESQRIYWVLPSQWKNHPTTRLTDGEIALIDTRHERDAVSMGKYFIRTGAYASHERPTDAT